MHRARVGFVAMFALLIGACGITGLTGSPVITSRFSDSIGDASAPGGTVYDITQLVTNRLDSSPGGGYDTLQVVITFVQTVVLPPPGSSPDSSGFQLGNLIHIDADQNAATGFGSSVCGLGGLEFIVQGNATRFPNGNYPVFTGPGFTTFSGEATPSASGNVLTVTIPLSALGGDDGQTHLVELATQQFFGFTNFTDCAPGAVGGTGGGAVITREPAGSKGVQSR